jgi:hypothetical protein
MFDTTQFYHAVVGQLALIDSTNFTLIVILSVIAAICVRELMDGATMHALIFLPGFIVSGCLARAIFASQQMFLSAEPTIHTLASATVGLAVALLIMLSIKRLILYIGDVVNKVA